MNKKRSFIGVSLLVVLGGMLFMSCETTREDMLVGRWQASVITLTMGSHRGVVVDTLPSSDEYRMVFDDSGLCTVEDRSGSVHYEWYLSSNGDILILANRQQEVAQDYRIEVLEKDQLVLSQRYAYTDEVDSLEVEAVRRYEMNRI